MYTKNKRFNEIMKALGLSQKEMSEKLGVDQSELSRISSCKKPIGDSVCYALICKLYINPAWLEDGEGDMFLDAKGVKRVSASDNSERISELKYTIELQRELIEELKENKTAAGAAPSEDATCAAAS